jgi:hypothetical protein
MTTDEISIIHALSNVTYLPGSFNKRFIRSLNGIADNKPEQEITEKQREWMYRLLYTYRRQVPIVYEKHKDHPHCAKLKGNSH